MLGSFLLDKGRDPRMVTWGWWDRGDGFGYCLRSERSGCGVVEGCCGGVGRVLWWGRQTGLAMDGGRWTTAMGRLVVDCTYIEYVLYGRCVSAMVGWMTGVSFGDADV